jgi:DNA repair protein RadC
MFASIRALFGRAHEREGPLEWAALPFDQDPSRYPARPPGFGEGKAHVAHSPRGADRPAQRHDPGPGELRKAPRPSDPPFPSTGPHGHRQRMREKLLGRGADALADYELLEMLLFFAQPKGDTKPLAKRLINRFGSFGAVLSAEPADLMKASGIGEHGASAIKLVQASAVRLARADVQAAPVLSNWDALIGYLNAVQGRGRVEQFRVLFLDPRNRLLADEAQARGTVNHTPVYPREIVKRALELQATALILVHNHPSGDPTPSREDETMTHHIVAALAPVGVTVHDHIIVGNGRWLSFRREGLDALDVR